MNVMLASQQYISSIQFGTHTHSVNFHCLQLWMLFDSFQSFFLSTLQEASTIYVTMWSWYNDMLVFWVVGPPSLTPPSPHWNYFIALRLLSRTMSHCISYNTTPCPFLHSFGSSFKSISCSSSSKGNFSHHQYRIWNEFYDFTFTISLFYEHFTNVGTLLCHDDCVVIPHGVNVSV